MTRLPSNAVALAATLLPRNTPPVAAGAFRFPWRRRRVWRNLLRALVVLAGSLPVSGADAAERFPELRVASAYRGTFDVDIYSAAWSFRAPAWTRANRLEFSAGVIRDADVSQPFAFLGPVWRLRSSRHPAFLDFSFGPIAIGGSTFNHRELGGNLHFRSALALGVAATRSIEVAVRVEHISNGGLRSDNPGLDSIGLSVSGGWGVQ